MRWEIDYSKSLPPCNWFPRLYQVYYEMKLMKRLLFCYEKLSHTSLNELKIIVLYLSSVMSGSRGRSHGFTSCFSAVETNNELERKGLNIFQKLLYAFWMVSIFFLFRALVNLSRTMLHSSCPPCNPMSSSGCKSIAFQHLSC